MANRTPAHAPEIDPAAAVPVDGGGVPAVPTRLAEGYVAFLRRRHPGASPGQLLHVLQKQYLLAMSFGGAGTGLLALRTHTAPRLLGLSAAHLGTGTGISTVYLLCLANVYALGADDARDLVRRCALGDVDPRILEQQFAGTWWRTALAYLPASQVRFTRSLAERQLERAARRGGVSASAAALPAGIGGTLGFAAGRILANRVIDAATNVLGAPPRAFAVTYDGAHGFDQHPV